MRTRHLVLALASLTRSSATVLPRPSRQLPVTLRRESGNLVLEGVPQRDPAMTERLARYMNGRDARFPTGSPMARCSSRPASATWSRFTG